MAPPEVPPSDAPESAADAVSAATAAAAAARVEAAGARGECASPQPNEGSSSAQPNQSSGGMRRFPLKLLDILELVRPRPRSRAPNRERPVSLVILATVSASAHHTLICMAERNTWIRPHGRSCRA